MKFSFLERLQRLTGPIAYRVETRATGPEAAASEQALQHLLGEIPDLLQAAVLETATGRVLASYTTERTRGLGTALDCYAETARQAQALARLCSLPGQMPAEVPEELLFALTSQLHLLRLTPDGRHGLYLAVDALDTNLGIAKALMSSSLEIFITHTP